MKSLYDFSLACLHDTGLGWGENLKTVTASQKWWDNNAKGNKEKKAIQFGPPPNIELLDRMFDKSKVSGLSACIPGKEAQILPINVDIEEDIAEGNNKKDASKEAAMKSLKRKAKIHSPGKKLKNPMVRMVKTMVDDVMSSNSITNQALSGDFTRNDIKEVMKIAKETGAVEGTNEHYMAKKLLMKSENRDIFLTFETNEGRLNWLKRNFEDRKK